MSGGDTRKGRSRGNSPGVKSGPSGHVPVLLTSVLQALDPKQGEIYIDGTFGAGGYTRAILEAADCRVIAIDRDPQAQATAENFKQQYGERFSFIAGRFGDLLALLKEEGVAKVDGVVLDVGVSSMQIDDAERGFSFASDGPA